MTLRRLASALALGLLFLAPLARADQCEIVSADVATRASQAIAVSHGRVLSYCAPCGDPEPRIAAAVVPHEVHNMGTSVVIDGNEVDLAYTYLEVAPGVFENVAMRTGCPAQDVPEVLRFRGQTLTRERFGRPPPALRQLGWGGAPSQSQRLPLPG